MNILLEFSQIAARFPDHLAIDGEGGPLSYRQLQGQLEGVRSAVAAVCGASPMVVTLLPQSLALVRGALGSMGAGKVFVPLDPLLPAGRLALLLAQLDIGLVVTERQWLPLLQTALPRGAEPPPVLLLDDVAAAAPAGAAEYPAAPHCYLYFTSGSTGTPKAVLGRTDSLLHFIGWEGRALALTPADRVSLLTAQMFDPFLRDLLLPLLHGATLCIPPSRELVYAPMALLAWFAQQRISITHMIPSLFQMLLEQPGAAAGLARLRVAALAGEMLKGSLVERFYALELGNTRLFNLYGPTETTLAKFHYEVGIADRSRAVIPVGRPIDGAAAYLVDQDGCLVADGVVGEVLIATPHMSAGYLHAPAGAAAPFFTGAGELAGLALYRTGDLGRRLDNGDLELAGRKDFQIKIDGQRIELGEIESALERHAGVKQAIVHYVDGAAGQKILIAYLKLRAGAAVPDAAAWRAFLAPQLIAGAIPSHYQLLDSFPMLANGKIDRGALRPELTLRAAGGAADAPLTPLQAQLAQIWRQVLRIDRVGVEDGFFALGGSSLLAIRMLAQVQQMSGVGVPFGRFFAEPTLAALALYLASDAGGHAAAPQARGAQRGLPSADQQRIVFHQHLAPDSCVYNMAYTAIWEGPVERAALQGAVDALLARHAALRTRFVLERGEAVAEIDASATAAVNWLAPASASAAQAWLAADARRPFDLAQPPLLRVAVLSLAPAEHVLYLCLHHSVADAWSLNLIWEELFGAYCRTLDGQTGAATPAPALTLLDVADWQARQLDGAAFADASRYWLARLAALPAVAQLPYDRAPAAAPSQRGARFPFTLPAALTRDLKALAAAHGATPYMALLAAFSTFLQRYTQQRDVLVGTPLARRQQAGLADLVGFLVNILVIRSDVDPQASFAAVLAQVRQGVLEAIAHQEMPFDKLVELLNPPREPGVSPLFQVMFAYQDAPPAARRVGPARVSAPAQFDNATAKYDLTLEMWDDGQHFSGLLEYASERFDATTVARMAANFECLLGAIVAAPQAELGRLALLAPGERATLAAWNDTAAPFSDRLCIHQLIERQARATPDGVAVVFGAEQLSYAELDARANQLAQRLVGLGVGRNATVGISVERSPALVIGFLAILKAGGVYVPVDPDYPLERRRFMIGDAGLRLLLTQEKFADVYREVAVETLFLERDAAAIARCPATPPAVHVGAEDSAYIIYTSGSTGRPKGVLVGHRGVCNLAEAEIALLAMTPASRVLQFASFSFDTSIWEIVMTLCAGGALVMAPARALLPGPDLLTLIERQRVSHATLPASALAALPFAALPALEVLIVAGEACGLDLLRKWAPGRRFVNSYGPTEATVSASNAVLPADAARIHIGKPLHNTQIHLLDGQMQQLPIGVAGELYIGGVGLASGYHRRPELSAERFVDNPFGAAGSRLYRSGDLARWLPDGNIEYLGRIDQQVKIRGFRVELGEIETVLRGLPAVRDAVAMVRADYLDASAVVAYVLLDAPDGADLAGFQAQLRASLPEFMLPAALVPLAAFPRLPNNKVDRARFPRPEQQGGAVAADAAPRGDIETALAAVWSQLLGRGGIGRAQSFFELGGHSLLAAKAAALLAAEHGIGLGVAEVFEHKSIAELALRARRLRADTALDPLLLDGAGAAPLSFAQQRMWFVEQLDGGSAAYNIGVVKHVDGAVDAALLCRSLDLLLARHGVFATRLGLDGGAVSQSAAAPLPPCRPQALGALDAAAWQAAVRAQAEADAGAPFELLGQPLYRLRVLLGGAGQCAVVLVAHHLLLDEASMAVLDDELPAIYAALEQGRAADLAPLALSYQGFARWDRSPRRQAAWQPQLAYWQAAFASLPPLLALPADFPRDAARERDRRAGGAHFALDGAASAAVRALAARCGTTAFNVLLAAFQLLLHRYTGERDICVGVPVAVRPLPQLDGVVGLFLNTVALRARLAPGQSFLTLLAAARDNSAAALASQEVPFERVVDAVDPRRERAGQGLFQVMLAFTGRRAPAGADQALRVRSANIDTPAAKFDLTLFIDEHEAHFSGKFEYRSALFLPETMARLAAHFVHLLGSVAAEPERAVAELPMLAPDERQLLLHEWNATEVALPNWCAHQRFEAQVRRVPGATAWSCGAARQDYRTLNERANRLARHLRGAGIGRDSVVGVFLPRSEHLLVALLAVLKAGAAYLPIDAGLPAQRLDFILRDSAARLLITSAGLAGKLPADADALVLDRFEATLAGNDASDLGLEVAADDLAYVIYTSGSTGQPKGVMMPHRGLSNYLAHALEVYDRADGIGNPVHSSIAFDATITSLYLPLLTGKQLFIVPEEDEIACLGELWQNQPGLTLAKITPAHLELLSKILPAGAASHTAVLVIGGEALHANALRFWREHAPAVRVINEYGPTEATVGCCIHDIAAGECGMPGAVPIGRPIRNTRLYVLNEAMQPLPLGAVGELYIGGAGLARGYLNRPDLTAERFVSDPFSADPSARLYKSGDLVKYAPDGVLHFLGRRDHQIKLRGYRIELGEVEASLSGHPFVLEAAAAVLERHGRKHLLAYVVLAEGIGDTAAIRTHLAEQLPSYMVPSEIVALAALPLTSNGKIDREALARLDVKTAATPHAAARTPLEATLAEIWQGVLECPAVGVNDNFFELGGDSILSLQIVFKARQAGLLIHPRMVFEYPTIAELASVTRAGPAAPAAEQVVGGALALTPIQRWFFQYNAANPHHFNQSYLFDVAPALDLAALEAAFAAVLEHHDGLRTRYSKVGGQWQASIGAAGATPFRLQRCRLPADAGELGQALAQHQRMLNIETGPLLKAVHFDGAGGALLLVVVHHLVVDGVSWRILLDDLLHAYAALAAGRALALPAKTASFQQWAGHLAHSAGTAAMAAQAGFWRDYLARPVTPLPRDLDMAAARNSAASSRKVVFALDADATRQLLAAAPAAYHAKVSDVLLAALAATLRGWGGGRDWRIDMEGHGRDGFDAAPDVSRTVGWFTTIYPVLVALGPDADDLDALLKTVKEAVRGVPQQGAGFGLLAYGGADQAPPAGGELCFNYLGRFDHGFTRAPLLGVSALPTGPRQAAENRRAYLLEVDAFVHGATLTVEWTYSECCHREATVRALAADFGARLGALIRHCAAQAAPQHTPSDFPLAALDQAQTDLLCARDAQLRDVYPLTPTQEGMVFHALSAPAASLYVEQLCFRLAQAVAPQALRAAWQRVAERHPALRTRFDLVTAGTPLQLVSERAAPDWRERDCRAGGADDAAALDAFLLADRLEGFDLRAPLYRITLLQLPQGGQCMVLSHHHALLDGWSVQLLLDEVGEVCRGGAPAQQPRPFRDYLQAQRLRQDADAAHWRQRLGGLAEATPLPAARAVLAPEDGIGRAEFRLAPQAQRALEGFARGQRVTVSTVVQAAWALLLQRYTGSADCLFGVTVSGRAGALPGIEAMVGLFICTVPARIGVDGAAPVGDWLRRIQREHQENEQHTGLSLADIKQQAGIDWQGGLFESILVFENYPGSAAPQEPLFRFEQAAERTNFPLTVVLSARGGLHGHIHYERRHYTAAAAEGLARHLLQLVEALAARADAALDQVAMLAPEESAALLAAWAPPARPFFDGCAHQLFEAQARATPERAALRYQGADISYAELERRAEHMAAQLRARGVGPDRLVGLYLRRTPELVVAMLATLKAGGAYIPIDASYPAERVAYMVADSRAALLITETALRAALPQQSGTVLLVDGPWPPAPAHPAVAQAPTAASLAYVIYTSGSTGQPKGVMIEHRGLVNYLTYARRAYGAGAHTRAFLHSSISFDATITSLWLPLIAGGTVLIVPDERDATGLAAQLAAEGGAHLLKITPVHLELLGQTLPAGAAANVAAMVVGGEALPGAALAPWRAGAPAIRIFNEYGPTETVVGCCVYEVAAGERLAGSVPIGQPIDNTQLYVLDAQLRPLPFGATGELYIGGAGVARGYLGRAELSRERFVASPFAASPGRLYRSGDLVRALPDGNLDYVGRRDQQVKLRGYRIELGEIEAQLAVHPALRQAAVALHRDGAAAGDASLVAYVVAERGEGPGAAALREYLRARLPEYMVPNHFVVLDSLPQTANGKLDYKALPAPAARAGAGRAPATPLEQSLHAIWCEVLGRADIGVDDSFFDLGGHSLKALRMMARIEQQLAVALSVRQVFDQPTIAQLALLVGQRRGAGVAAGGAIPRAAREGRRVAALDSGK
ncbi:non-ribosomal peptide synthetase [Janthinobacterium fluminis]|uniref:Amino acid adenylation domain-containing protein n=1 Tax=Janthinobacterium fluminis TaxID=2987524 RepID=A0ABT5JZC4_9BURK|nr:non-ribosomal peptide synthetase [Janthinobacterium fluminis]MDC8758073.1 amino acid adenylation domain-containing protein [Janthinobacterium fluminis]